ncbi:hypothetical protein [uncultured Clostridium sp.]|uniref:hypothetical protein n=1 Tax=uncultured Clostridium sp. TaxID=59620 RepID=UPI0025EAE58A|nr:hypothetical protein [uncultured Clostridium sp.]
MKPYNKEYILEVLEEYNNAIKNGSKGLYKIDRKIFKKKDLHGYMYKNTKEYDIDIIELSKEDKCVMRLDPREIESSYETICYARGKVGIVGLGLGYVAQEISKKNDVSEVIVYEVSQDVIDLYKENFGENDKIKILCGDAFKAERERFDFFYVDIYGYSLSLKVVRDYKKFNKLHEIEEYSFWGMEHFMLSCRYEDILWVYVPENWVSMCKNLYTELQSSGYIDRYKPLGEKKVTKILSEFKEILNSDM